MPVGTTVAIVSVAAVLLAGGGFLAGRGTAPDDVEQVAGLVEAQSTQIDILGDQMAEVAATAGRPVVIDAEIRDKLSDTPPACIEDPLSLGCHVQACWQYGQSAAQRPQCQPFEAELVRQKAQGYPEPVPVP
jgi:hypothetical protein